MSKKFYKIENFKAEQILTYHSRRLNKQVKAHLEALFAPHGVTYNQYAILMNICDGLAVTASEICQNICHDAGALTRILDQMVARGLIARARSESDRRRVEMELTPAGTALLGKLIPLVVDLWNGLLADTPEGEMEIVMSFLKRLADKVALLPKQKAA